MTRCPHPDIGPTGATTRHRPSPAAACRKAARPGASQPSSLVKTRVGSWSSRLHRVIAHSRRSREPSQERDLPRSSEQARESAVQVVPELRRPLRHERRSHTVASSRSVGRRCGLYHGEILDPGVICGCSGGPRPIVNVAFRAKGSSICRKPFAERTTMSLKPT